MPLYVQIKNDAIAACWDTLPPVPIGTDGWKNAIEVKPPITAHRQGYTQHVFDLTKDPVEIVYGTYDIPVDDRKQGMKANAGFTFQQVVNQQARDPATYDPAAIEAARQVMLAKQAQIDAATTHDELDALM